MAIEVNLILSEEEKKLLAGIIGCRKSNLDTNLQPYARSALEEYVRMIIGQKVFTRGSDIKEYRLFLLIKEAFNNKIPDDQKIADLFQTTPTESRSLIRSVMSKYQYELKQAITQTLKMIIKNVKKDEIGDNDYEYTITIDSASKIEELNRILSAIDGTLPQVMKKRGSVTTYTLQRSSYVKLCGYFHLTPMSE